MEKSKMPLDLYDYELTPPAMKAYLRNYGFSFSKKACEYAVSLMEKKNFANGMPEKIEPWSKEKVEECFKKNNVAIKGQITYNHVYVFNMALADYPKSIPNEMVRCLYVKETLEDVDSNPENVFRKWIACMDGNGMPIYWEDLL
jgi:hypothetical protein